MSSLNARTANDYYNSLDPNSGSSPLVNGATQFLIQPGSTFKVVTTASIFDHDPSIAPIAWPYASFIHLPQTTKTLQNYAGEVCGGSLATALAVSCDTADRRRSGWTSGLKTSPLRQAPLYLTRCHP